MQDGQFQEAESEVIDAATLLVRTLLAEGVDPDRLRHVLRSLMLYDLIGSMASDDPWAKNAWLPVQAAHRVQAPVTNRCLQ